MAESVQNEVNTVAFQVYGDDLRTSQYLQASGILPSGTPEADQVISDLLMVKMVTGAMTRDWSNKLCPEMNAKLVELNKQAKAKKTELPTDRFIDEYIPGYLSKFLEIRSEDCHRKLEHLDGKDGKPLEMDEKNATEFNLLHKLQEKGEQKYTSLKNYYDSNPNAVKNALARPELRPFLLRDEPLPFGRLVAESKLVAGAPELVNDLVSDVVGVAAARRLLATAGIFPEAATLAQYTAAPEANDNDVRIAAKIKQVLERVEPLNKIFPPKGETAELQKIIATEKLVGAAISAALNKPLPAAEAAAALNQAAQLSAEAAQAMLSLSYDYLSKGPAKDDARIASVRNHLKAEMDAAGIALLPPDEALKRSEALATTAAKSLMTKNEVTTKNIGSFIELAKAAGIELKREASNSISVPDSLLTQAGSVKANDVSHALSA